MEGDALDTGLGWFDKLAGTVTKFEDARVSRILMQQNQSGQRYIEGQPAYGNLGLALSPTVLIAGAIVLVGLFVFVGKK